MLRVPPEEEKARESVCPVPVTASVVPLTELAAAASIWSASIHVTLASIQAGVVVPERAEGRMGFWTWAGEEAGNLWRIMAATAAAWGTAADVPAKVVKDGTVVETPSGAQTSRGSRVWGLARRLPLASKRMEVAPVEV